MEWQFTPDDVIKGNAAYYLAAFRGDLLEEVRLNLPDLGAAEQHRLFDLIYDLHYWRATGREFDEFVVGLALPAHVLAFLASVAAQCGDNVAMLGAILQRAIMDGVASGLPLDQALDLAAPAPAPGCDARQFM